MPSVAGVDDASGKSESMSAVIATQENENNTGRLACGPRARHPADDAVALTRLRATFYEEMH